MGGLPDLRRGRLFPFYDLRADGQGGFGECGTVVCHPLQYGLYLCFFYRFSYGGRLCDVFCVEGRFYGRLRYFVADGHYCFLAFFLLERKGIVRYNQYKAEKSKSAVGGFKVLFRHQIVKFTFLSIVTGVVRTSVVFWLPTYLSQKLGYSSEDAALIFTVATFIIAFAPFIAIFLYERLHYNMNLTVLIAFIASSCSFFGVFFVAEPLLNVIFLVLGIISSNMAASMVWSRYCLSLRDTGMVSGVTGFLDFVSYMAAAASSAIFANAVAVIGWNNLVLVWLALMIFGVIISLPYNKLKKKDLA